MGKRGRGSNMVVDGGDDHIDARVEPRSRPGQIVVKVRDPPGDDASEENNNNKSLVVRCLFYVAPYTQAAAPAIKILCRHAPRTT